MAVNRDFIIGYGAGKAARAIPPGGDTDLSSLEVYIADFLTDPPTVTEGALNTFHRTIVS